MNETESSHPSRIYKAFLDYFVAEGVNKVPFHLQEIHRVFYEVLDEDPDLATKWQLLKRINPYSGTLDATIQWFHRCGLTSIDDLLNPRNIVILDDMSKYHPNISEKELGLARRIHDNYKKLIATSEKVAA